MEGEDRHFVCGCFYTNNYFIENLGIHVRYLNSEQFLKEQKELIKQQNLTESDVSECVVRLENEKKRRYMLGHDALQRMKEIQKGYFRMHSQLYRLVEENFDPQFLSLISKSKSQEEDAIVRLMTEIKRGSRIYSFPVFTETFCRMFIEEINNFETSDMPKGRPNTMNNYGILVDEIGFDRDFLIPLREKYLTPLCRLLYPDWGGAKLDSHKAFVVKYKVGEDTSLKYHYDNAEITINIALGGEFDDGSLYFGNMRTEAEPAKDSDYIEYNHQTGCGLLHRGQHKHGAMPITDGVRFNLIIWMRSSSVRNKLCPMCDNPPDLVQTTGRGDGFTADTIDVCSLT